MLGKLRCLVLLLPALSVLSGCNKAGDAAGADVTMIVDPGPKTYATVEKLAAEFEVQTGHHVRLLKAPADTTERLSQYLQYLGAGSEDIDIYQVDVIWPAILQNHLADLTDAFTSETSAFLPAIIKNNTVDGHLVAVPWYVDVSMLYYRDDLLAKHGFANPPATWDDLTTMAQAIQDAERRSGNPNIWGFVWQGRAYEGLTCNALEWQMAEGGGRIVNTQRQVEVNNAGAIKAFERAAAWVNTISPAGVTTYAEEEARQTFQAGNAVFMRNWPYAYSLVNGDESPIAGKVKTAVLPAGSRTRASTLGGWQLAIARYSRRQKVAVELLRFMTSAYAQKERALTASVLPTRLALYDDADIAAKFPFIPAMRSSLETAVVRPSSATGSDYNEVSTYYFQHVHRVLTRQETAADAMADLDTLLQKVLQQ